jgi:hypothetical protein
MSPGEAAVFPYHVDGATLRIDSDIGEATADVGSRAQRNAVVRVFVVDDRVGGDGDRLAYASETPVSVLAHDIPLLPRGAPETPSASRGWEAEPTTLGRVLTARDACPRASVR